MMMFNAELHQYSEDGVVLPSVTQVLAGVGLIDTHWHKPWAAAFGTRVHKATAALDRGERALGDFGPRVGAYAVAWWMFRETQQLEVLEIEQIVGGLSMGYAGTLDRLAIIDGDVWVLDIKTGSPRPWHALQLAGYALAVGLPCRRMAVYLQGSHAVRKREYKAASDFEDFRLALALVQEVAA